MKNIFLIGLLLLNFSLYAQSYILVVDEENIAIKNATVQIEALDFNSLTNGYGLARVPNLTTTEYVVHINSIGYLDFDESIVFNPQDTIRVVLALEHRMLDYVMVSSETGIQRENITSIQTVDLAKLSIIKNESLGEALANIPGVDVSGLGPGISKINIRGLSGSRVVTYVNSLRIENQQWGGDHGLPITSLGIGEVSVIKGPASLLYGADALGGVLYFQDEDFALPNSQSISLETGYNDNSDGLNATGAFKISKNNFKLNVYANYTNHADYQLPNGNYVLNTRINQVANKVVMGYQHKHWVIKFNYDFNISRIGLPGHAHEAITTPASFETTSQSRRINAPAQAIQNHFFALEQKLFLKNSTLFLTMGHTRNGLKEYEEKLLTPEIIMDLNNSLYQLKWRYKLNKLSFLTVGSQGMYQLNKNGITAEEYLIPDASTSDIGLFALLNTSLKRWRFQMGGRIDHRNIDTKATGDFIAFNNNYLGFNYALGGAYLTKHFDLRINVSSGFRAPTTSELLSSGIHHGANRFEQGNDQLKTEKATQLDLSFAFKYHDLELIVNPFYNLMEDYIYLNPTIDFIEGYQVYTYEQVKFANLYGTDMGVHYHPHQMHWMHLASNFSMIIAKDANQQALPLIPPLNIKNQVKFDLKMKSWLSVESIAFQHVFYDAQNNVALYEVNAKAYHLFHFNLGLKMGKHSNFSPSIGVKNIFNTAYIPHLSSLKSLGIYQPGRSFNVSLKYEFKKSNKT